MTPFYHLIFADWESNIARQATALDSLIQERWGRQVRTILDVSCGIGTQALGLAQRGYAVTASDLSTGAIERTRQEATQRGLALDFSVADMRRAFDHHQRQFDLVLSADNSLPHLLTDAEILIALRQFYRCTRPGGGCLITLRDYDRIERTGVQVQPYGLRVENDTKYLIFQVWEFEGELYHLSMYFIADHGSTNCLSHVMRTHYYAISPNKLLALMEQAGFVAVERLDDRFYQPVLIGQRPV